MLHLFLHLHAHRGDILLMVKHLLYMKTTCDVLLRSDTDHMVS